QIPDRLNTRTERAQAAMLLGAALVLQLVAVAASSVSAISAPPRADLSGIRSWVYQLQQVEPDRIAASAYDLAVIDFARDGSSEQAFSQSEVAMMKRKPEGQRRIVLAYLSIGEAEDYRSYWHSDWSETPPTWLG